MDSIVMIEWLATILSLIGCVFIAKKRWEGWCFWLFGAMLWVTLGIFTGMYGLALQFSVFCILNIYGMYEWRFKR